MADHELNPLLHIHGLPAFAQVRPQHVLPAVKAAIEKSTEVIKRICAEHAQNPTWDNTIAPIEETDDTFSKIWSVVSHLNSVCNTPELRKAYEECLPLVAQYSTWVGQYRPYFEVLQKLSKSDQYQMLTKAQRKSIENSLRDFRLTGIDLDPKAQQRFSKINERLSQLQSDFANHVLDATHSFTKQVSDEAKLSGLPAGAKAQAAAEAKKRKVEGWVFTLDIPSYLPLMTYADNRQLRQEMYEAFVTRASEIGPDAGKYDNGPVIEEILKLRHEMAHLLGFKSYAHLSLATKMASDPKEVLDFLNSLASKSHAQGEAEMGELSAYAASLGLKKLEPWDVAYYAEKLREERCSYNAEALRVYFPVDKVLNGVFECARRLYGITLRPHYGVEVWHDDVVCYDVHDEFGSKIGSIYIDLYARAGKRGGAWMDECMSRRYRSDGALQLPVAYLVCNFTPPLPNKCAQLTHDEVVTLFHEFGHVLNQILTRIDIADVSGINGVPWDAVELPSQFNENYAWQEEALNFLSSHVRTGEPLPVDKLTALLKARNFESAMAMLRQLEFALFDFRVHLEYDESKGARVYQILDEVRKQVCVTPLSPLSRFPDSFTHVFAGGYAAGYYSYKWAEVLAADAFGRFLEEGIFNHQAGIDFRDYILAGGGAEDPMQAFIAFRGRKPQVDALLKQSGINM